MAKVHVKSFPNMEDARKRVDHYITDRSDIVSSPLLKSFAKGKKFYIRTYGCQANIRDSEILAGILTSDGFSQVEKEEDADLILINTCAVRENAEDKVYGEIGNLKQLKQKNKDMIIGICGCMVQQKHIISFINEKFPHIDLIFGTHNITHINEYLDEIIKNKYRLVDVLSNTSEIKENLPSVRMDKHKAFVNIMYGCNKFCTYCIVPYTRGRERSRNKADILKECKDLVDSGYLEITLLGQNVNSYGKDLNDGSSFANLLDEVAKLGIKRLRFTTSHPWDFNEEIVDVIAKHDNIMKQIHLPVQSGNDNILRLMGRRYTSKSYLELVKMIKEKIPNIALSTDIIVGFPNETYEEFLDTIKIVKEVQYDSAFLFIYSPRKGTPAARIEDNVSYEEKSKRFIELSKEMEKIIEKKSNQYVGKILEVLVDGESKNNKEMLSGYSEQNKIVHFKGDASLIGKIVKVKILENHTYSLIGELVNE